MISKHGVVNAGDLRRLQLDRIQWYLLERAPTLLTKQEARDIIKEHFALLDDLVTLYGIDDSRAWEIAGATGEIYYKD